MPGEVGDIVIVDYDPRWPAMFADERTRLLRAIGDDVVGIEHVGSTAIHGLGAKPIIDILVGVRRIEEAGALILPLEGLGYEYVPEYESEIPDRRYFRKGPAGGRTLHLHTVAFGGEFWTRHLLFRDFLRAHPEVARRYDVLKRDLAVRFRGDRDAYAKAKTAFVQRVEARARVGSDSDRQGEA